VLVVRLARRVVAAQRRARRGRFSTAAEKRRSNERVARDLAQSVRDSGGYGHPGDLKSGLV
jgi:hypothetical protein